MVRVLPEQAERVETGPTQFGDDWPGIFIRGDNAFHYAQCLKIALNGGDGSEIHTKVALGLVGLLESCNVHANETSAASDLPKGDPHAL